MYYGHIINAKGDIIDEVTMVEMPAGKSYTGQAQAEIFCHGGQYILKQILQEIYSLGARPAEPGEFTRQAFLTGRIDLARAEAVAEMINSKTEYSYRAARNNLIGEFSQQIDSLRDKAILLLAEIEASIDYPEENLETAEKNRQLELTENIIKELDSLIESYRSGKIIKEGFRIAIAGRPNAGKSSLFNLMLNQNRAIVAPSPGTTRDYLTEWIELDGLAVSITDTAGLRKSKSTVEIRGQAFSEKLMGESDLIIWIADISEKNWRRKLDHDLKLLEKYRNIQIIFNKIDLIDKISHKKLIENSYVEAKQPLFISCKTKIGLKSLKKALTSQINKAMPDLTDCLIVTSERQKKKLADSLKLFRSVDRGIRNDISPELIAFDLRQAIGAIDEITGRVYTEEILDKIFSQFCIGK